MQGGAHQRTAPKKHSLKKDTSGAASQEMTGTVAGFGRCPHTSDSVQVLAGHVLGTIRATLASKHQLGGKYSCTEAAAAL